MNGGKIEIVLSDSDEYPELKFVITESEYPGEDKRKIFSDFYRASNVKHKIHDGTGTGLVGR